MGLIEKLRIIEKNIQPQTMQPMSQPIGTGGCGGCGGSKRMIDLITIDQSIYQIKIPELCAFVKQDKLHKWLGKYAPDIADEFLLYLSENKNCQMNTNRFYMFMGQLRERQLISKFLEFIVTEYPIIIQQ